MQSVCILCVCLRQTRVPKRPEAHSAGLKNVVVWLPNQDSFLWIRFHRKGLSCCEVSLEDNPRVGFFFDGSDFSTVVVELVQRIIRTAKYGRPRKWTQNYRTWSNSSFVPSSKTFCFLLKEEKVKNTCRQTRPQSVQARLWLYGNHSLLWPSLRRWESPGSLARSLSSRLYPFWHCWAVQGRQTLQVPLSVFHCRKITKCRYNESILGRFLLEVPRESVTIASKFMPRLHKNKCDFETGLSFFSLPLTLC